MRRTAMPILALLILACGGSDRAAEEPEPQAFEVARTAEGGPVTLSVRLSRKEIGLADSLVLEEEVRVREGFLAELPEFAPEELEGIGVTDLSESPPAKSGALTVLRRRLVLEPERSGTLTIPSREAWFRREGEESESSVRTEPIEVTVRPIEDAAAIALPDPRPALRPEEVARRSGPRPWWVLLLVPPAAVAAVVLLRRRRRKKAPPPRPAHEIAWEALRRLVALGLLEKGEVERFFVILSAILREYVERRFQVRAPERTTEEFLSEASRHGNLAAHRGELGAFLEVADHVKFARYKPDEAAIQRAFDRARAFVTATQEVAGAGEDGGA